MEKLSDAEIMKAMECCNMRSGKACSECPYHEYYDRCITKRNEDIVDLIKRQQAEIDGFRNGYETMKKSAIELRHQIKEKRGEWKINPDGFYPFCSCCGHEPENRKMSAFCPGCGADMRGKQR